MQAQPYQELYAFTRKTGRGVADRLFLHHWDRTGFDIDAAKTDGAKALASIVDDALATLKTRDPDPAVLIGVERHIVEGFHERMVELLLTEPEWQKAQ